MNDKKKALIALAAVAVIAVVVFVITKLVPSTPADAKPTQTPAPSGTPTGAPSPEGDTDVAITPGVDYPEGEFVFTEDMEDVMFSHNGYYYTEAVTLKIFSRLDGDIYYTLDGNIPTKESTKYDDSKGITLFASLSKAPNIYPLRVKAFYKDGTTSKEFVHTYFVGNGVKKRYTTLVFSIVGTPEDLTSGPDGIFYGDNYKLRGKESERPIHLEVIGADGTPVLSQFAGVRIYGGASRESYQKSMKFYARKSYDPDFGSFRLSCMDELRQDGSALQLLNYDKFVLRNSGNDFQFAYIRDELNQRLAARAGFRDYEVVLPAIAYRNGKYIGFYWLHGNYCDDYFQTKYGTNPSAGEENTGEFIVLEGGDTFKNQEEEDEVKSSIAEEYEAAYNDFITRDLTDDAVYAELTKWMDVENYLDYFAYNIYLCNSDWPQNNYKCYRYVLADDASEQYTDGTAFDGRWRYLLHDTDYTLGLYEQNETRASFEMLRAIMNANSHRHSPLFTLLMERSDCRAYFVKKSLDFANGALSSASLLATLQEMNDERSMEMNYYYNFLETSGSPSIWTNSGHFDGFTQIIRDFAVARPKRAISQMQKAFELGETYTLTIEGASDIPFVVNSFTTDAGKTFSGTYFTDYETTVKARLPLGHAFGSWTVNGVEYTEECLVLTADMVADGAIKVTLNSFETALTEPVIYEFSARDSDFITLWNPTDGDLALSDYTLTVGEHTYRFPADTTLASGTLITVYCKNYEGDLPEGALTTDFAISDGETLALTHGDETIGSVLIPRMHNGFVMRLNQYTGTYEEAAIE